MSDGRVLFREFLRAPTRTATLTASSDALVAAMIAPLPLDGDPVIVELGAGTGRVTDALQRRLARPRPARSPSSSTRSWRSGSPPAIPPSPWSVATRAGCPTCWPSTASTGSTGSRACCRGPRTPPRRCPHSPLVCSPPAGCSPRCQLLRLHLLPPRSGIVRDTRRRHRRGHGGRAGVAQPAPGPGARRPPPLISAPRASPRPPGGCAAAPPAARARRPAPPASARGCAGRRARPSAGRAPGR